MHKVIISLFMILFLLLSCDKKRNPLADSTYPKETNKSGLKDTVILSITPTVLKISTIPDTINVYMVNRTADTLTTGLYYDIQRLESNRWVSVIPDQQFQDIGFRLLPDKSKSFTIKIGKDQALYPIGKYRIVKHYLKQNFISTREKFPTYAEFKIE